MNLPEKKEKKSELDSKLVLGVASVNCPPATEDLAQNLGYLVDQSLLVSLLWALCGSTAFIVAVEALYGADECLPCGAEGEAEIKWHLLPTYSPFFLSQKQERQNSSEN